MVSTVGLGTWQLGGEWGRTFDQAAADAIVDAAREAGITLIDTAECYGDHRSERLVGAAIREDRDGWTVATKFGHRFVDHLQREERWSAGEVRQQLEDSLRALGSDWIDLYQFHSGPNDLFDNDELWAMLRRQVEEGRIRFLGISVSSNPATWLHQAGRAVEVGASAIQLVYNRLRREPERELLPLCERQELGVLARVPLASGLLSGTWHPGMGFGPTDHRSRRDPEATARELAEVERIRAEEVPGGMPMAGWALA